MDPQVALDTLVSGHTCQVDLGDTTACAQCAREARAAEALQTLIDSSETWQDVLRVERQKRAVLYRVLMAELEQAHDPRSIPATVASVLEGVIKKMRDLDDETKVEVMLSMAPCNPDGACATHGRCWTHSEACDGSD